MFECTLTHLGPALQLLGYRAGAKYSKYQTVNSPLLFQLSYQHVISKVSCSNINYNIFLKIQSTIIYNIYIAPYIISQITLRRFTLLGAWRSTKIMQSIDKLQWKLNKRWSKIWFSYMNYSKILPSSQGETWDPRVMKFTIFADHRTMYTYM